MLTKKQQDKIDIRLGALNLYIDYLVGFRIAEAMELPMYYWYWGKAEIKTTLGVKDTDPMSYYEFKGWLEIAYTFFA